MTQKILIIVLAVAMVAGCSKQRRWDEQQKHQLRKEMREYRNQGYLSNIPESDFIVITDSVTEVIANKYPNYDAFKATPGSNDTVTVVLTEIVADQIAANHKYMRYLFPYLSLVANGILPINMEPDIIDSYYDCVANKVNETFASMQEFMYAIGTSDQADSVTRNILSQCATDAVATQMSVEQPQ